MLVVDGRFTPASKLVVVGTILKLRQTRGSPELGLDVTWPKTPGNINFTTTSKSPLLRSYSSWFSSTDSSGD